MLGEELSRGQFLDWIEFASVRGGIGSGREDNLTRYLAEHSSLRVPERPFEFPWQPTYVEPEWDEEDDEDDED